MTTIFNPEAALIEGGFTRAACPADFDAICSAAMMAWRNGLGVLLSGAAGCGKTFAMRCLVPPPPPYPAKTRWIHFERDHEVDWIGDAGCLSGEYGRINAIVFDDLGIEGERCNFGEWRDNVAQFFTNHQRAIDAGKRVPRLFVTTNLSSSQVSERYGDRMYSRLRALVVSVKMTGVDKRRLAVRQTLAEE